ncbi:GNAT family N-acetyltransferase [Halobacillus salinus]|uniref:Aminoglycoside N(6')-acetyltransferase type 1 n=1 Tax=Halobacillus salinus TaxID=192814 RepID=A0A4Z0GWY3_9BACI|nr:GNAT family N-acetyltransferase [Halobacillus salinus]TGB02255.1 GNAT family N-acetyltransferase [Halobacillus salinus]
MIRRVNEEEREKEEYVRMRKTLWPHASDSEHRQDIEHTTKGLPFYKNEWKWQVFVIERPNRSLGGFIELSLYPELPFVDSKPVAYIEGWYVDADLQRQGFGRKLVHAGEYWALEQGCLEIASDVECDNVGSQEAHMSLGFRESHRSNEGVYYKKYIGKEGPL